MDRDALVRAYYQGQGVGIDSLVSFWDTTAVSHAPVREGIGGCTFTMPCLSYKGNSSCPFCSPCEGGWSPPPASDRSRLVDWIWSPLSGRDWPPLPVCVWSPIPDWRGCRCWTRWKTFWARSSSRLSKMGWLDSPPSLAGSASVILVE